MTTPLAWFFYVKREKDVKTTSIVIGKAKCIYYFGNIFSYIKDPYNTMIFTPLVLYAGVWALVLGGIIGYALYSLVWKRKKQELQAKLDKADDTAADIIKRAEERYRKAENISKELIENAQREFDKRMQKADQIEERFRQKEEKMEQRMETLETEKQKLIEKQQKLDELVAQEKEVLSQIARLSPEEAKEKLFELVEQQYSHEISTFVEKFKALKQEEADKEATAILTKVMPRVAVNAVSEFTVSLVEIPSEDTKGKLIWREGRNVSYFEKITGVEVIIDDTPLIVRLSSYDNEKRFLATETLKRLIKDGRINPVYIEKVYNEVAGSFDQLLMDKGKEALMMLNIPMMKPDVVKMIGQFQFRYSYGQNLWIHSIEVAKTAEAIALEMGLDGMMAKKAGLLHDIGKIATANGQSHTQVGGDILKKYWFDEIIVNTAQAHHFDVPLTSAIGRVVTAADAISAGRPGARFNAKEVFIEKMSELEKLISSVSGVDKVHIMQAGREIMVFVDPAEIDDIGVQKLIKDIGSKVEDQLDYPGIIRVVAIRETKVVDYLR